MYDVSVCTKCIAKERKKKKIYNKHLILINLILQHRYILLITIYLKIKLF